MRKRYLLDYAMFAESDNFGEGVEATTDESPFLEGGTSTEGAEGAAEENESAAEGNEDVNVES